MKCIASLVATERYTSRWQQYMSEKRNKNRNRFKKKFPDMESLIESDENIAFIVGYTSNGVPYGLTHKEWENINLETPENNQKDINDTKDLPF